MSAWLVMGSEHVTDPAEMDIYIRLAPLIETTIMATENNFSEHPGFRRTFKKDCR
jgi:hypothetical protein